MKKESRSAVEMVAEFLKTVEQNKDRIEGVVCAAILRPLPGTEDEGMDIAQSVCADSRAVAAMIHGLIHTMPDIIPWLKKSSEVKEVDRTEYKA